MCSQRVCLVGLLCGLKMCVTLITTCIYAFECVNTMDTCHGILSGDEKTSYGSWVSPSTSCVSQTELAHQPWQQGPLPTGPSLWSWNVHSWPVPRRCWCCNAGTISPEHMNSLLLLSRLSQEQARPTEAKSIVCCWSHRTQPLSAYVQSSRHALHLRHQIYKMR